MQWYPVVISSPFHDGCDGPFLAAPAIDQEMCEVKWSGPAHWKVTRRRPVQLAWTGEDVRADVFAINERIIIASSRVTEAFKSANITGCTFHNVNCLGYADYVDDYEVKNVNNNVSALVASFLEIEIVAKISIRDTSGTCVMKCPICGFRALVSGGSLSLEWPESADIAWLEAGVNLFANSLVRDVVQTHGLRGVSIGEAVGE